MKKEDIKVKIDFKPILGLPLWDAIKLRIAGKNYENLVNKVIKNVEVRMKQTLSKT